MVQWCSVIQANQPVPRYEFVPVSTLNDPMKQTVLIMGSSMRTRSSLVTHRRTRSPLPETNTAFWPILRLIQHPQSGASGMSVPKLAADSSNRVATSKGRVSGQGRPHTHARLFQCVSIPRLTKAKQWMVCTAFRRMGFLDSRPCQIFQSRFELDRQKHSQRGVSTMAAVEVHGTISK
jgi:hypothetical protein